MDAKEWNGLIRDFPQAHLLQTWEWGQIKSNYNWRPHYEVWRGKKGKVQAAALILQRDIRIPGIGKKMRILYVPKGPLLSDWADVELRLRVLSELHDFALGHGAFFIKIDPNVKLGIGVPGTMEAKEDMLSRSVVTSLRSVGWRFSNEQVQFRNTVLIDLSPLEEELLAGMKQKTRYNVRVAERKGVKVRVGSPADFETLANMYTETSIRDGFVIRAPDYYHQVWQTFYDSGMLSPLIAEVEGEPIAALMLFVFAGQAWYIYGMSRAIHRDKMPNYFLQWEAIRLAKAKGCQVYDMWGAPDEFTEKDFMWGVYRFKRGFGGQVARYIGAWDLPVKPMIYFGYTQVLPRVLSIMRRRGRVRAQQKTGNTENTDGGL